MSLTVGEVLENAQHNLSKSWKVQKDLGEQQMKNYTEAKRLGASDDDDWDKWSDEVYKNISQNF